ncbi:MAG: ADOP family duplicated permease [Vicinamibacterales bacterium]
MKLFRHLVAWLRRDRLDDDLREELAQHHEWTADRLMSDGVPPDEARRRASVQIGNSLRLREQSRGIWGFAGLETIAQDIRYGVRLLLKSPVFTLSAVLSLGIGIGATAAVFSLANTVLLRSMPVPDPSSLFEIKWTSGPVPPYSSLNGWGDEADGHLASTSFSYAAYDAFQSEASRFMTVLGFADLYTVNLVVDHRAELETAHAVSGNYFSVLGVGMAAGRALSPMDDKPDAPAAAVISDDVWKRHFDGGAVIGRSILINAVPFTIVGVLPAAFHGTGQVGTNPGLYVPLALKARVVPNDDPPLNPNFWWVLTMGRLKPGARPDEARNALDLLLKRTVAAAKPQLAAKDLPRIELLHGGRGQVEDRQDMQEPLETMALVTIIVLLVACANVAGLLLARGRGRAREVSLRVAIGAPRGRIVRQLFTEAMLIACAGAAFGVAVAHWLSAALAPALGGDPQFTQIVTSVDSRVLLFVAGIACTSAVLFGLGPALRTAHVNINAGLQDTGRAAIVERRRGRLTGALMVAQIALALLLVASAGLLVRSLRNLQREDLGFDPSNLLVFKIDPSLNGYEGDRATALYAGLLDRLRATPGVKSASLSNHVLIANSATIASARRPEEAAPPPGSGFRVYQKTHEAWILVIDTTFFDTFGMHVLRGRAFTKADATGAPAAIINSRLARQLYKTDDVVGRQFYRGTVRATRPALYTIVGVVDDAKYGSVRDEKPPTMYVYYRQAPGLKGSPTFELRTAGPPSALASTVRQIVRAIDPTMPVYGMVSQQEQIAASLRQERLFARLATLLGMIALLLSAIGLYGLLAYGVVRRTPEIGLRMALGAARGRVQWMVLRESLLLAALGLGVGVPLALAGTNILASLLFGLDARDPATLIGASIFMIVLAAAAGYLPARRASRVDPLVALRAE